MTPDRAKTPASAPIGAVLAGAAVAALQAIVPLATGVQPNWALMASTFLFVFLAALGTALYHLELPSGLQQAAIADGAALLTAALAQHAHTAIAVPVAPAAAPEMPPAPAPTGASFTLPPLGPLPTGAANSALNLPTNTTFTPSPLHQAAGIAGTWQFPAPGVAAIVPVVMPTVIPVAPEPAPQSPPPVPVAPETPPA